MSDSSKPSASVIAAAIVALLGGLLFLLTSSLSFLGILLGSGASNSELPPFVRSSALVGVAFLIGFSLFGIATGVGLLLVRNWARLSALIWAGLSVFFGAAGVVILFFALPPQPDTLPLQQIWIFRLILAATYGTPLFIGIWWLILFNHKAIKWQFTGSGVPAARPLVQKPRCPTPLAVLAWLFIASALNFLLLPFLPTRLPILLFGYLFTGRAGRVFLILICALIAIAGVGLLKLKRWSYPLAIGMQCFGLASLLVSVVSPNFKAFSDALISDTEKAMPIRNSGFLLAHYAHYISWGVGFSIVWAMATLGILFYYRTRFLELATAARG